MQTVHGLSSEKDFPEIFVGALKLLHRVVFSSFKHIISLCSVSNSPLLFMFFLSYGSLGLRTHEVFLTLILTESPIHCYGLASVVLKMPLIFSLTKKRKQMEKLCKNLSWINIKKRLVTLT